MHMKDTMYTNIARPQKKMFQTINSTTVLFGEMYQLPGFELQESRIRGTLGHLIQIEKHELLREIVIRKTDTLLVDQKSNLDAWL
jgi:hypothetical protein